ncbi:MAG TPA: hypothetical protein VMW24_22035, partial [Sedimentisphaerales bacterium]|nr:hypothetical protein [Sedimentisphaerales bacterium]
MTKTCKLTSTPKTESPPVIVPLYPFDRDNSETATLNENQVFLTRDSLTRRIGCLGLLGVDFGLGWGDYFRDNDSDINMNRFKQLVRRFLIDTRILTQEEAVRTTFFELAEMLMREIDHEADRRHEQRTEGVRDMWKTGLVHKEHWQARARQLIDFLEECNVALSKGEQIAEAPFPFINIKRLLPPWGFRLPNASDLPWLFWVLGRTLESVFGIEYILIPRYARQRLESEDLLIYKMFIRQQLSVCSFEDCKAHWPLLESDLLVGKLRRDQRKGIKRAAGDVKDEQSSSSGPPP